MHSALLTVAHSQNDEQRARAGRGRGIRRGSRSCRSWARSAGIGSEWLPRRFLHVSHHLPVCICFVVFDCRLDFHVPFLCTRSYTRSLLLLLLVVVSDSNRKQHRLHVYTSSSTRGRKSDESRDTALRWQKGPERATRKLQTASNGSGVERSAAVRQLCCLPVQCFHGHMASAAACMCSRVSCWARAISGGTISGGTSDNERENARTGRRTGRDSKTSYNTTYHRRQRLACAGETSISSFLSSQGSTTLRAC